MLCYLGSNVAGLALVQLYNLSNLHFLIYYVTVLIDSECFSSKIQPKYSTVPSFYKKDFFSDYKLISLFVFI
jgi:hypothetical protein